MSDDATYIGEGVADRLRDRDELFRLRGEFISRFVGMESMMNVALLAAVGAVDPTHRQRVQRLLLAQLNMRSRLEALWALVRELKVQDRFTQTRKDLRRIMELRNEVAHSDVSIGPDWTVVMSDPESLRKGDYELVSQRWTRHGLQVRPGEKARLLDGLARIDELTGDFICLVEAIVASDQGHDPVEAIAAFDEANAPRRRVPDQRDLNGPRN